MTRECENIREQIGDYIEGMLSGELSKALNEHLEQCPDCREYFDALVADDKLLSGFAQAMLPELNRLENAVMEKLDSTVEKPKVETYRLWNNIFRNRIVQISAAAAVLFVLGISIAVHFDTGSSMPVDVNKQSVVEGPDSFKLDADAQKQIAQIQNLIDANQIEILASVLEMPLAAKQSKLLAAQFLAGKNDIRGLSALEMLTSEDKTSDTYIQTASKAEDAVSPTAGSVKSLVAEKSMLNAAGGEGKNSITAVVSFIGPGIDKSLDGKIAVVRIYDNWRSNPEKFGTADVEIKNRAVNFDKIGIDANDVNESPVVVVFCDDQKDPNVAEYMSECVYAATYNKDLNFSIPTTAYKNRYIVFNDACIAGGLVIDDVRPQGKPVPQANVEVYLVSNDRKRICLGEFATNVGGDLVVPHTRGELNHFDFVVSQPDYGIAKVSNYLFSNSSVRQISLPLVRKDSEEAQRAVRGYVVDSVGRPVSGAEIYCAHIRTLGEGLIDSSESRIKVISGEDGRFRLYLLNTNSRNERGNMIPPKSKYSLRIDAPRKMGLIPFQDFVLNDNEYKIVLEKGDFFRRFAFYDENGLIAEQQTLETLNVHVKPQKGESCVLYYNDIKNGAMLPYGSYEAQMYIAGHNLVFEPIEVNAQSPETLVFKLSEKVLYYGSVIDGITGRPMDGAFVIAMSGQAQKGLAEITEEQWLQLHDLKFVPDVNNEALAPVRECYGVTEVVRTNSKGYFQMSLRPGAAYGFVAFEKNYLPVMHRTFNLNVDKNKNAEVPVIKLYPAAKVLISPVIKYGSFTEPPEVSNVAVWPRWIIEQNNNPQWVKEFLSTDDGPERTFTYDKYLKPNVKQILEVPAGLNLKIKLDTPYDAQWCPVIFEKEINLRQGDVLDLGDGTFERAVQICVTVVDSQGNFIEGVPIRIEREGTNVWSVAHNTDGGGKVSFYACPNSKGRFGIHYDEEDNHLIETIPYEIGEYVPGTLEFKMTISEQMLNYLFK